MAIRAFTVEEIAAILAETPGQITALTECQLHTPSESESVDAESATHLRFRLVR